MRWKLGWDSFCPNDMGSRSTTEIGDGCTKFPISSLCSSPSLYSPPFSSPCHLPCPFYLIQVRDLVERSNLPSGSGQSPNTKHINGLEMSVFWHLKLQLNQSETVRQLILILAEILWYFANIKINCQTIVVCSSFNMNYSTMFCIS